MYTVLVLCIHYVFMAVDVIHRCVFVAVDNVLSSELIILYRLSCCITSYCFLLGVELNALFFSAV